MTTSDTSLIWEQLVAWVNGTEGGYVSPALNYCDIPNAGRGLVVTENVPPSTILVTLPSPLLLNGPNVSPYYPQNMVPLMDYAKKVKDLVLNSTQAISMHLCLKEQNSQDAFAIYRASLPRSFAEHPLAWLVLGNLDHLVELLPPSCKRALKDVHHRFNHDWDVVQQAVALYNFAPLTVEDYLWGWLIVNTRCFHYSLSSKAGPHNKDYDLTLCPVFDFANHTIYKSQSVDIVRDSRNGSLTMLSPKKEMKKGEEVFLCYAHHSNVSLFSEYGFVTQRTVDDAKAGGEVNVDDIMEAMIAKRKEAKWLQDVLEVMGYWGDWVLYSSPPPAQPSYRVLSALRLLNIQLPAKLPESDTMFSEDEKNGPDSQLEKWKGVMWGFHDSVDPQNDALVRKSLKVICEAILERSLAGKPELEDLVQRASDGPESNNWSAYSLKCIKTLWEEETEVSKAIVVTLDSDFNF